jgi:hypothetical protein
MRSRILSMNEMCVSVCQYCPIWPGIYSYNIDLSSCFTVLSERSGDVKQMKQAYRCSQACSLYVGSDSSTRTREQDGPSRLFVFRRTANVAFSNSQRFSEFERTGSCRRSLEAKSEYAECFKGWDAFVEQHMWAITSPVMTLDDGGSRRVVTYGFDDTESHAATTPQDVSRDCMQSCSRGPQKGPMITLTRLRFGQ